MMLAISQGGLGQGQLIFLHSSTPAKNSHSLGVGFVLIANQIRFGSGAPHYVSPHGSGAPSPSKWVG